MYTLSILPHLLLLLLPSASALAVPSSFYAAEECHCEPFNPQGNSSDASLAECQRIASHLQTMRMRARNMPYLADIWLTSSEVLHINVRPEQGAGRRHAVKAMRSRGDGRHTDWTKKGKQETHEENEDGRSGGMGRWMPGRRSRASSRSKAWHTMHPDPSKKSQKHTRGTSHTTTTTMTSQPRKPQRVQSVAEQLALRHPSPPPPPAPLSPLQEQEDQRVEKYNILCRARPQPSSSSSSSSKSTTTTNIVYISVRPIPFLFVFVSVVLACTLVIDWLVELVWTRHRAASTAGQGSIVLGEDGEVQGTEKRIFLEGSERRIWAVAAAAAGQDWQG